MKKDNLSEFEKIFRYLERKGFKLELITPEVNGYIFIKNKIVISLEENK